MKIVRFFAGDTLVMKKSHPCGENKFKVLRAGSDVRMVCTKCGRDVTVDRMKIEKNIKNVIISKENAEKHETFKQTEDKNTCGKTENN